MQKRTLLSLKYKQQFHHQAQSQVFSVSNHLHACHSGHALAPRAYMGLMHPCTYKIRLARLTYEASSGNTRANVKPGG